MSAPPQARRKVYFVSGLGADERAFQFLDLPGVDKIFVKWLPPGPREPLPAYCQRLLAQIDLSQEINLVGMSFGGIVCQEMARLVPCRKVLLISSVKSPREMGWQLRLVARSRAYRAVPARLLKWSNLLTANHYFSVETPAEAALLRQIIEDTDPEFARWAIAELMAWPAQAPLPGVAHLHGGRDRIFPAAPIRNATIIADAGHFMVVNRAAAVSAFIARELN
ncbi:alpha/beta hydrolase [Hymenobacter sp.]|uniref:alpha/beta hydrolase n=1 Tax=Hymenobacter sp. TaxID=1898978 RepID=UPI00286B605D|nr:alpha/beta hydrolase [Hymenobacter sp.]